MSVDLEEEVNVGIGNITSGEDTTLSDLPDGDGTSDFERRSDVRLEFEVTVDTISTNIEVPAEVNLNGSSKRNIKDTTEEGIDNFEDLEVFISVITLLETSTSEPRMFNIVLIKSEDSKTIKVDAGGDIRVGFEVLIVNSKSDFITSNRVSEDIVTLLDDRGSVGQDSRVLMSTAIEDFELTTVLG